MSTQRVSCSMWFGTPKVHFMVPHQRPRTSMMAGAATAGNAAPANSSPTATIFFTDLFVRMANLDSRDVTAGRTVNDHGVGCQYYSPRYPGAPRNHWRSGTRWRNVTHTRR